MITFFSTPRPFEDNFKIIQENAISSWANVNGEKEIILFDTDNSIDIIKKYNDKYKDIRIINDLKVNSLGTPLISDLFQQGQQLGKGPIYCFLNCDIIIPEDFLNKVIICSNKFNKFLLIGHRFDLEYNSSIDFSDTNHKIKFWNFAKTNAKKHGVWGIDYFVFTPGVWEFIPDFAIGRFMYDNWLIWQARRNRVPVIDATYDIMVVHQNHDYNTNNFSGEQSVRKGIEGDENRKLFGNAWNFGIQDATHNLVKGSVNQKTSPKDISWYLYRLRKLYPEWKYLMKIYNKFYRFIHFYKF